MNPFKFAQGASISFIGNVVAGDPAGFTPVAYLRPALKDSFHLDGFEPIAAQFTVAFVAAVVGPPSALAYWILSLSLAQSLALVPGYYLADIRLTKSDNVTISQKVAVVIELPVTRP